MSETSSNAIPAYLPLRNDLIGEEPYGAPQLDVPVCLNVNENPYAPEPAVVETIAQRVKEIAPTLNRYPDREHIALRQAFCDYLERESGVKLEVDQLWGANGSNEIMLQLFQAFGGPGRIALSCDPTYSMYPEYARDTFTTWKLAHRNEDFSRRHHQSHRKRQACHDRAHQSEQSDRHPAEDGRSQARARRCRNR